MAMTKDQPPAKKRRTAQRLALILANAAVAAAIFGYLFSVIRPGDVLDLLRNVDRRAVTMFVVLSLATTVFRLWRYRILLRLSGYEPPPFPLFLMVLVRNAFSDLLPARLGTLIDVYFFTTRFGIPMTAAASCYSLAFAFEILSLAPLILIAAVRVAGAGTLPVAGLLGGGLVLFGLAAAAIAVMPWAFDLAARIVARRLPARWPARAKLADTLAGIGTEIRRVRTAGLYGRVLALSVMLRISKYATLYVFLFALLHPLGTTWSQLDPSRVFLGLCASEFAASLPISGIAGFGAYEGAWMAVFRLLGFPADIAAMTSVAHHLFTQAYGYGLGAVALTALFLPWFRRRETAPAATPVRDGSLRFYMKITFFTLAVAGAAVALALAPEPKARAGAVTADRPSRADRARLAAFAEAFDGDIVYDSLRSGTFGIWRMTADGSGAAPVIDTAAHEMYPDPSPDGRWIVYARAESLARTAPSSIHICRPDGSEDRLLAKDGTFPSFGADGVTVFFERGRTRAMAVRIDGGEPREVFPGTRAFSGAVVKPRPSPDGRRIAFISNRGGRGWQAWIADLKTGEPRHLGAGCEPGWFPDGRRVYCIRERGMKGGTGVVMRDADRDAELRPLHDGDEPFGKEYFPCVTPDGRWLLWSACRPGQHSHTDAASNYQIFARELPGGEPVRLTFDGWNNRWPRRLPRP